MSGTAHWVFSGERKLFGNSPRPNSWLPFTLREVRLVSSPILSGSAVETSCLVVRYRVLDLGRARKILGNSLVSWFFSISNVVRFFRLQIDLGRPVETRCSFYQYCALGFQRGEEAFRKLTKQQP